MGLLANSTNRLDTRSGSGLPADAKASDNNEGFVAAAAKASLQVYYNKKIFSFLDIVPMSKTITYL